MTNLIAISSDSATGQCYEVAVYREDAQGTPRRGFTITMKQGTTLAQATQEAEDLARLYNINRIANFAPNFRP